MMTSLHLPSFVRLASAVALAAACLAGGRPARAQDTSLVATPTALRFERPNETRTVRLMNAGAAPVPVTQVALLHTTTDEGGGFLVDAVGPRVLAPGEAVEVPVTWAPAPRGTSPAPRHGHAALVVTSRQGASERQFAATVPLRATSDPPWLSLIVFFPLFGIPLLFFVPRGREPLVRWVALAVTAVPFVLAALLVLRFEPTQSVAGSPHGGLQFVEHVVWIRGLNVEYFLGVDGLSISMVLLSTLVSLVAVGASWSIPLSQHVRGYFALLLLLEVGMTGVFCALDFFLFYVLWEVMLLPMYFLIGIWGGPHKEYAAIKFFLYTLAGSVLMLLALIALYFTSKPGFLVDGTAAAHTFDLTKLALDHETFAHAAPILGLPFGPLVFVLLFLAFAVKVPSVPLHTWLPDAHVEAPTAISVILAGVLLKMGPYGLLRINWAVLPEATHWASDAVAWIGAISIVWGALCAMAQKDLKRLVAYSSVSHMGYCMLGLAALTPYGTTGALVQMFNHGVITSMLFLLVGVLYDRTHTRGLDEFGGVARVMPRYAAVFGLAFMASLGLPGLSGFIGEALVFLGAFEVHRIAVVVAGLALVLTAAYHLTAVQKIQLGPFNERWRDALVGRDLSPRETLTLLPLGLLVIVLGFYPMPLIQLVSGGVGDLVAHLARAVPAVLGR